MIEVNESRDPSSNVSVVSLPRNVNLSQLAVIFVMLAQVIAVTAYIVSDSERQRSVETTLSRHIEVVEEQFLPGQTMIQVELRAINVRLNYLEARLERHDLAVVP